MIRKPLSLLLAAALIVPALAAPAEAAKKRHKRTAQPSQPTYAGPPKTYHQAPARMIEIAPGKWISSWGCFTDEGYGRYGTCDMREGPR
jgi:hypothetical protein